MIHRLAIILAAAAAASVLALSMAAAGFGRAAPPAAALDVPAAGADSSGLADGALSPPTVSDVTDTVYVEPVPPQKVIHVTKPAASRAMGADPRPRIFIKHAPGKGDDGEGGESGHEGGD